MGETLPRSLHAPPRRIQIVKAGATHRARYVGHAERHIGALRDRPERRFGAAVKAADGASGRTADGSPVRVVPAVSSRAEANCFGSWPPPGPGCRAERYTLLRGRSDSTL